MTTTETREYSRSVGTLDAKEAHIYDRATGEWLCGIIMPDLDMGLIIAACREMESRGRKVIFEVIK